jgi:hypothetical protein
MKNIIAALEAKRAAARAGGGEVQDIIISRHFSRRGL